MNSADYQIRVSAGIAERLIQVLATLVGAVFLISGVSYLYLGRVTCLLTGNFWSIYAFSWNHTWFQSALLKQAGHVTFFPSLIGLANLRFFKGDVHMLFLAGLGLLCITVSLLLIPIWRDTTVTLTAKTLATLVMLLGNFWLGRASITANGEFNCDNSLAMGGAALAFLLIDKTTRSWTVSAIVVCAGFLASFSFGAGLAVWPTLLLLAWCLRLPWRTVVLVGFSTLTAAIIYALLPVLPSSYLAQEQSGVSLNAMDVLTGFCGLTGSPVLYSTAAWRGAKALTQVSQSVSVTLSGMAGLTLAGSIVIPRVFRRDIGSSGLERTGFSLLIFNTFALALITIGRLTQFNLVPSAPRYLFWSSLFWTGLILLGINRAERLRRGRLPTLLLTFAIPLFAWPAHYQAALWCKNAQILYDNDATALINGAVDRQRMQSVPPEFKKIFEERLHLAWELRARHLDVFADGLQDWIGLAKSDVFGARDKPQAFRGECRVDALGQCDNGAPAARVSGRALKDEQSIPSTLVITDSNGVIRGVARSARISPFVNRTFYQGKLTAKLGFVGYIRDYNPELRYVAQSADNLTLSNEAIVVQH